MASFTDLLDGSNNTFTGSLSDPTDTVSYAAATTGITVDMRGGSPTAIGTQIGTDNLVSIENVITGSGDDVIYGGGSANRLEAGAGDDFVDAGGGDDIIIAGPGNDTIVGGSGTDTLVLAGSADDYTITLNAGTYTIVDKSNPANITTATGVEQLNFAPVFGFKQSFESGTSGVFSGGDYGTAAIVTQHNGITAPDGGSFALLTETNTPDGSGPYTKFGGYRTEFTDNQQTGVKVYLDTNWAENEGFSYSVAANGSDGNHQRDFAFLIRNDGAGHIEVGAANGATGDHFSGPIPGATTISESGWYTLEHVFRDDGGHLAVDLNLVDANGVSITIATLASNDDTIPGDVGGNRYGWFVDINVDGGLAVDDITLGDFQGGVTEGSSSSYTDSGVIAFSDSNVGDNHSVTVEPASGSYLGTFEAIVSNVATADNQGSVTWTFNVANEELDHLGAGVTVTQTYTIALNDGHGGISTQNVTVTITGANDAPATTSPLLHVTEAGPGGPFEPMGPNLDSFIAAQIDPDVSANDMDVILDAIQGQLPAGSGRADAIAVMWDYIDEHYSYYDDAINVLNARLSIEYAQYLKDGGQPLTDVRAKHDLSGRDQSLHDNLLGNVNGVGLADKLEAPSAEYDLVINLLTDAGLLDLLDRPWYGGYVGDNLLPTRAFDELHGLWNNDASGTLTATDVDGDSLTWSGSAAGTYGDLVVNGSGAWSYTLDSDRAVTKALAEGETRLETFVATVSDGHGGTSTATINIVVHGTNDAPEAVNDTGAGLEDALVTGSVAANDSDVDNGADLSYAVSGTVPAGFTLSADGTWELDTAHAAYQNLAAGEPRTVTVTYTVTDEHGGTDTATLEIVVTGTNDAPTGSSTAVLANGSEDTAYTVSAADLLAGFSDIDGDTLSVANVTASNGAVVDNGDGTYTVTPTTNFHGPVTLTYDVTDGTAILAAQTQSYTVDAVNDAPTGSPTAALANGTEDTAYTVSAADLLAGFSDIDGDTLAVANLAASNGTVVDNGDGTFTITPAANFNGAVTLTYDVTDGTETLAGQTRSYTVDAANDAPTGIVDTGTAGENETKSFAVLDNDTDVDNANGDLRIASIGTVTVTGPNGPVTLASSVLDIDGTGRLLTFSPGTEFDFLSDGENATVTVTYIVTDGDKTSQATLTLTVNGANEVHVLPPGGGAYTGTNLADDITGSATDDTIYGLGGDDVIDAGNGDNVVDGGSGNDTITTGAGDDRITGGSGHDTISAGAGDNTIDAGSGNDTIIGGPGIDTIDGGSGIDTVDYSGSGAGVRVDLRSSAAQTGGFAQGDVLSGIENLIGSAFNDRLFGGSGANTISGGDGDDTITGGAGADSLDGGDGIDTLSYATSSAGVTVHLDGSLLSGGDAAGDVISNFENLTGSNYADALYGTSSSNVIDGRAGADTMAGGDGDDVYYVDNAGDQLVELAGGGVDLVRSSVSFSLAGFAEVENLTLRGSANIDAVGNAGRNILLGNSGSNLLTGGGGQDKLTGGDGADVFVFTSASDSAAGQANRDYISDFSQVQGDKIDLSAIDANAALAGDQSFSFLGAGTFTKTAGELRQTTVNAGELLEGDVNGDGKADFQILFKAGLIIQTSDLIL